MVLEGDLATLVWLFRSIFQEFPSHYAVNVQRSTPWWSTLSMGDKGPLGQNLHFVWCNPCCLPQVAQSWFPKSAKGSHYFSTKKEPKCIITSEWLHFKHCWKSGPKFPILRGQWPMAKGPLDQAVCHVISWQ